MAIEFARLRYVKRSDGGNVCRSAAYNARADIRCARTGERFFFAHRDGVVHHEVLLPEGADPRFADPETLWNAAQTAEKRKDAQEARELLLALPCNPEIGPGDWREMAREFVREHFVSKGVAVQLDIHEPHEGDRNIHAHILVTTRRIEGEHFSSAKARDLDPEIRTLKNGRQTVTEAERWGAAWRDYQNLYFERHGLAIRVDETGIVPQRHEGPVRLRTRPEEAEARKGRTEVLNSWAARDPQRVLEAVTQRLASFTELDLERLLKQHIASAAERQTIRAEVLAQRNVIPLHERESGSFAGRYTTEEVRAEERRVMKAAAKIGRARGALEVRHRQPEAMQARLDTEQYSAYLKATGTDGLVVIEGQAGTGKSHATSAIRGAYERSGWRVIGLAPTNAVAADLRKSGFSHGSTAHLELYYQEAGRRDRSAAWDRKTLVIVDEAAMLDTRIMARLMGQAATTGARVILVGDDRQLASVERGGMFTEIKKQHGSATISKVRRQAEDWQRAASSDFAEGRIAEGVRAYAERGFVHWSRSIDESRDRLLSDWDAESRERPEVKRFVYAATNVEVNRLNRTLREIRLQRGEVEAGIEIETVRGKIAIGAGDRIQFHGNDRKLGIYNGTLGTVEAMSGSRITLMGDGGDRITFDAAAFNEFGLGYAGTVYRGQGKTQTEVYALYDSPFAWSARTAYVGFTRHQASVTLYVSTDRARDETALVRQMSREGAHDASLAFATKAEAIELEAQMRQPTKTKREEAEEKPVPHFDPADPKSAEKQTAELEDRLEAIGREHEERLASIAEEETEKRGRLDREQREATAQEQADLAAMRADETPHRAFVANQNARAAEARREMGMEPVAEPVTVDEMAFPQSAQLRYTEALASHYDPRDPYSSLARASLAEAAAYQADRQELDRAIAQETDEARREMLTTRREIEHADHMAQVYDRLSFMSGSVGGEAHEFAAAEQAARAQQFREQGTEARAAWEERGLDAPSLYPPLDDRMRERREAALAERQPERDQPEQDGIERAEEPRAEPPRERTQQEEIQAMRRIDLPAYAEEHHGYKIDWRDEAQSRAILRKEDEELRAVRSPEGAWSYSSARSPNDQGDIVRFEALRGSGTMGEAMERIRPTLAREEQEHGPLHQEPHRDRNSRDRDEEEREL